MTVAAALLDAAGGAGAVLARTVALGATVTAVGAWAFRMFVAQRAGEGDATASRAGLIAAAVLIVAAIPRLWLQARGFVDAGDPVLPMMTNVMQTRWGTGWIAQTAGAGVAMGAFARGLRRAGAGRSLGALATLALVAAPAFMGHAIAVTGARWLAVTADAVHTLAASAWTGGLAILTLRAARRFGSSEGNDAIARLIHVFHPMALASSATVIVTGALGTWLRVARLSTLLHTGYGAVLITKLVLVGAVLTLGALHSTRGERDARAGSQVLQRSLRVEVALAVLTIVVTALLVGSPPEPDA